MLKDFVKAAKPDEEQITKEAKQAREKLAVYQMKIKEAKLPVMVIFEGWGSAGKGSVIGRVIRSIDPRFFTVKTMGDPSAEDMRYPFLYRYMKEIPEAGKFVFFDTFWMEEVTGQKMSGEIDEKTYARRVRSINTTERSLTDNGYLVMKFFFHISKKTQKKRLRALLDDKSTAWGWMRMIFSKTKSTKNIWRPTTGIWRTQTGPQPPGISLTPPTKSGRSCRFCVS